MYASSVVCTMCAILLTPARSLNEAVYVQAVCVISSTAPLEYEVAFLGVTEVVYFPI